MLCNGEQALLGKGQLCPMGDCACISCIPWGLWAHMPPQEQLRVPMMGE